MSTSGLRQRARYWFDNTMSSGTRALIALLGLASLVLIGSVSGLVLLLAPGEARGKKVFWMSLLRSLDTGTIGGDDGSALFLGLMLAVTIGGLFIVSALVGVLSTGLQAKLAELRKGRSRVVERGHTVVLGWSDQIFTILTELAKATEGERACVAILADRDKVEMEDQIRARVRRTSRLRIVCRTGEPTEQSDLDIVRPDEAAVILVPAPADEEIPDVPLVATLLALHNREWPTGRPPVIAVVTDSPNLPAAVLAGGPDLLLIDAKDFTARLVVQSRRQPGMSVVCSDLLCYDGNEFYLRTDPTLAGATYSDALLAYETAALIGLRGADGVVSVNPPSERVIRADDEMVVIARNSHAIRAAAQRAPVIEVAISSTPRRPAVADRTLVLGWNDRGPTIIRLLDRYLPEGSAVEVAAPGIDAGTLADLGELRHLTVSMSRFDPTDRPRLEALRPGRFQHVIVLTEDGIPPRHADSKTLVTLLHLRDLKERRGEHYTIVSELNREATRRLAQVTRADDFVVGKRLISLLLTQLSRSRHLNEVFAELFEAEGSDIYLEPADDYLVPGAEANFATVVEAARRRGETAIGYRRQAGVHQEPGYGVVLNPAKCEPLTLSAQDQVVVLAVVPYDGREADADEFSRVPAG